MNDSIDRAKTTLHHSAELVGLFVRYEINACSKADRSSDHRSSHDRSNSTRHLRILRKKIIVLCFAKPSLEECGRVLGAGLCAPFFRFRFSDGGRPEAAMDQAPSAPCITSNRGFIT
jgi:hypothetical protein